MRILFVAMPYSVHAARWINQLSDQGWDIHLFPTGTELPHSHFNNITIYGVSSYRPAELDSSVRWEQLWPPPQRSTNRLSNLAARIQRRWAKRFRRQEANGFSSLGADRAAWLAQVVSQLKPDIVHSLEMQHAGYMTLEAKSKLEGQFPAWIVTNWGSDIYLFGRLAEHKDKIKAVLSACDYYQCECHRDVNLARAFGFTGEVLPVCPVTGGFDVAAMRQLRQPGPTSSRRLIALKGYQHWAGRALVGLRAIELCAEVLQGYRVVIYLPSPEVKIAAELVMQSTGVPIELEPTEGGVTKWSRDDILRMHGNARISIGLSISDAISTSLLEAMVMESFPIQSNTGCGDEWVKDGESALFVPPNDPEPVAAAIRRAVADDALVDRAAEINAQVADERLDKSIIQPQAVATYNHVAAQERLKHIG